MQQAPRYFASLCTVFWICSCVPNSTPSVVNSTPDLHQDLKPEVREQVIYGSDNRRDMKDVNNSIYLNLADSVAALIRTQRIRYENNGYRLLLRPYGQSLGLCSDEAFYDQGIVAHCSGFLVAQDIVATAGHCMKTIMDCATTHFVFGFRIDSGQQTPDWISSENVYSCQRIVVSSTPTPSNLAPDFALVQLDRPVQQKHQPVDFRLSGSPSIAAPVAVLGYPAGLPLKLSDGARIRRVTGQYFVSNLDTYAANSGSPVFNSNTGLVEGILVRGEKDFESYGNCKRSKICSNNSCRGEDATRINQILPYLQ